MNYEQDIMGAFYKRPGICKTVLEPNYWLEKAVFEVSLDMDQFKTNDLEKCLYKSDLPKKIRGIPIKYKLDRVKLAESYNEFDSLRERIFPNSGYAHENDPYTENADIIALRQKVDTIVPGLEVIEHVAHLRVSRGGTLGGVVWNAIDDTPYWIGCSHVFCNMRHHSHTKGIPHPIEPIGSPIYQNRFSRKIGELYSHGTSDSADPYENIDASIATIDEGIQYNPKLFGSLGEIDCISAVNPSQFDRFYQLGRSSGLVEGIIVYANTVLLTINGITYRCHETSSITGVSGDSGSRCILKNSPNAPIGIFFALALTQSYIIPSTTIETDLGITFQWPEGWNPPEPPSESGYIRTLPRPSIYRSLPTNFNRI